MDIIIFIIILLVLVVAHEWGHFFSAKRFGIRVDEFGFGFPPRAKTLFKKGDTTYTLNWLPIGGFVKIHGENPEEDGVVDPDAHRSMMNKPRWQQAIVLFAGIFMNFLLAWFIFSIGFMSGTMPAADAPNARLTILEVSKSSLAERAGLMQGDVVISATDPVQKIENPTPEDFISFVKSQSGKTITLTTESNGQTNAKIITLEKTADGKVQPLGIGISMVGYAKYPFFTAIYEGLRESALTFRDTTIGLARFIKDIFIWKADFSTLSGPVGMVSMVKSSLHFGFGGLLYFMATISISLAVLNFFPFPALDGGRLLFLLIEKIKGSRLSPKFANYANLIGFCLLMLLMLVVTYHDIVKLF